jgi:hypothetical protein
MTTDKNLAATTEGVRDAWDFWLSERSAITLPSIIESAIRAEVGAWLDAHSDDVIAAIAKAAAEREGES